MVLREEIKLVILNDIMQPCLVMKTKNLWLQMIHADIHLCVHMQVNGLYISTLMDKSLFSFNIFQYHSPIHSSADVRYWSAHGDIQGHLRHWATEVYGTEE